MAKFRCNVTQNVIEFKDEYSIKSMRTNLEYTEVVEEAPKKVEPQPIQEKPKVKE